MKRKIIIYTEKVNPFKEDVEYLVIGKEGNPSSRVKATFTNKDYSSYDNKLSISLPIKDALLVYDFRKVNNLQVVGNLDPEVVCSGGVDLSDNSKFYEAWTDGKSYIIFDSHNDLSKTKPGPEKAILFGDQVRDHLNINDIVEPKDN